MSYFDRKYKFNGHDKTDLKYQFPKTNHFGPPSHNPEKPLKVHINMLIN